MKTKLAILFSAIIGLVYFTSWFCHFHKPEDWYSPPTIITVVIIGIALIVATVATIVDGDE